MIAFLLILFARQWVRLWTGQNWSRFRFLQIGAGIGLTLLLLHSLVDFNLHIPANVVYFAFLAAVFFTDPDATDPAHHRGRRRTPAVDEAGAVAALPVASEHAPPPDQIRNPFLD
jgi:hypothetical protein